MKKITSFYLMAICLSAVWLMQGCATTASQQTDHSLYIKHMPQSILVLPPQNESNEVMAPYIYLSTVSQPIAEKGYYVYPVAVVDKMMKENGVISPAEMAQVPLAKIKEIIDPDAVLYITIKDWGTKFRLIDSATIVHCQARLVDTDTGTVLWAGEHREVSSSMGTHNSDSLGEFIAAAIVSQVIKSISDPTRDLACKTNTELFSSSRKGLLPGKRCPQE